MWLVFVVVAALSWGAFIPTIRIGQVALGSPFRAFLFIALAYTILGIVVSGGMLAFTNQRGRLYNTRDDDLDVGRRARRRRRAGRSAGALQRRDADCRHA